jgi:hypothetical protein
MDDGKKSDITDPSQRAGSMRPKRSYIRTKPRSKTGYKRPQRLVDNYNKHPSDKITLDEYISVLNSKRSGIYRFAKLHDLSLEKKNILLEELKKTKPDDIFYFGASGTYAKLF